MLSLRVRAASPAKYEASGLERGEREWLMALARRELNLFPDEKPTMAQLVALARQRNINLERVLR